jgi:hypothetical protein
MRIGFWQRAALTVVLIGTILAPVNVCAAKAFLAPESCCLAGNSGGSDTWNSTSCCKPEALPQPAVAAGPTHPATALVTNVRVANELAQPLVTTKTSALADDSVTASPPDRISVLRI